MGFTCLYLTALKNKMFIFRNVYLDHHSQLIKTDHIIFLISRIWELFLLSGGGGTFWNVFTVRNKPYNSRRIARFLHLFVRACVHACVRACVRVCVCVCVCLHIL